MNCIYHLHCIEHKLMHIALVQAGAVGFNAAKGRGAWVAVVLSFPGVKSCGPTLYLTVNILY